jgi:hypothetical protein
LDRWFIFVHAISQRQNPFYISSAYARRRRGDFFAVGGYQISRWFQLLLHTIAVPVKQKLLG